MKMKYVDLMIKNCELAKEAKPTKKITFNSFDDLSLAHGISKGVYIIELTEGDQTEVFNAFKNFKESKQRACAKLNTPSNILYVGSSQTNLKSRLKQHLSHGHKNTYALHMSDWFKGKFKVTIKEYDVSSEVLQIIEDSTSYELKPAFGKRGANNK